MDSLRSPGARANRLKVLFSQHGTRGVARVYVDLDGFAFVGIRPSLCIFLFAKITAVVAHLLIGIVVDIGQCGSVVGAVGTGFESHRIAFYVSDTHNIYDGGDFRPVTATSALNPPLHDYPTDGHEHSGHGGQHEQDEPEDGGWAEGSTKDVGEKQWHYLDHWRQSNTGGCVQRRNAAVTMAVVTSEASKHIILAENLTKVYAAGRIHVAAVRGVWLAVEPGEFVAIVGPSGSGKSTLFYLLGGLTRATEGRVVIDGVDFAALTDSERTRLRKHRIGFVFQKFNLLPTLTGMGNIEIAYTVSGRASGPNGVPMDLNYLDHLSEMLAIKGRLDHRPSELSGGEQQRVAIARALITRPAILLADEPTGNLDTKTSDAVLQMLVRSNRELGQTTLMITHNPEAAAIAGRILHMRDGQIVKEEAGSRSTCGD